MATIGGISCSFVRGQAPAKKARVRVWQIPGLNGYGAQVLGLGDSAAEFVAVQFGTYAEVTTWIALVEALQGTLATVVNDFGQSVPLVLVESVSGPEVTRAIGTGITTRGELLIRGVVT
jgi:hypothetical protein